MSTKNVRVSSEAWEYLRWAKFNLRAESYSQTIKLMYVKIEKTRSKRMEKFLATFDPSKHQVKFKTPGDDKPAPPLQNTG